MVCSACGGLCFIMYQFRASTPLLDMSGASIALQLLLVFSILDLVVRKPGGAERRAIL